MKGSWAQELFRRAARSPMLAILVSICALGLLAIASTGVGEFSTVTTHGWLGPTVMVVAWAIWAMGIQPPIAFTALAASAASLIVDEHLGLGLVGIALLFVSRRIQTNIEKAKTRTEEDRPRGAV